MSGDPEKTCWGLEAGSTANAIANLLWIAALLGAVIFTIVRLAVLQPHVRVSTIFCSGRSYAQ